MGTKKVLVTGASGFIGRHLCKSLHNEGLSVTGLVRRKSPSIDAPYAQVVANISEFFNLQKIVLEVEPNYIVHLAAVIGRDQNHQLDKKAYEFNTIGSINLIQASQKCPILEKFLFLGSCDEYGDQGIPFEESLKEMPLSVYGASKLAVTQLLRVLARTEGFPSLILRPSVVFGPGQGENMFIPALIASLLRKERFLMSPGQQTRDFVFVGDLITAISAALRHKSDLGDVVNISSGTTISIRDIAISISGLIGPDRSSLIDIGGIKYRENEVLDYSVLNGKARKLFDWEPCTALSHGLEKTIEYYRNSD